MISLTMVYIIDLQVLLNSKLYRCCLRNILCNHGDFGALVSALARALGASCFPVAVFPYSMLMSLIDSETA